MALTTINGNDGSADITIATVSYKAIFSEFELESNVQMFDTSVFSTEGTVSEEGGAEQITGRVTGLLKKGGAAAGPLIPAPRNVACVFTYSTGCTIAFSANFTRATARRTVNQNAIMAGELRSSGTITVVWVTS